MRWNEMVVMRDEEGEDNDDGDDGDGWCCSCFG